MRRGAIICSIIIAGCAAAFAQTNGDAPVELLNKKAAVAQKPKGLTKDMIFISNGMITAKYKKGYGLGDKFVNIFYEGKDYLVCGIPNFDDLAVDEVETCIVVKGDVERESSRRVYYWLSKDTLTDSDIFNFKKKWPKAQLE